MRLFLTTVLPLALPTLVYILYLVAVENRRREAAAGAGRHAWWVDAPWPWLVGGGALLVAITLGALVLTSGAPPGETYQPAHVENGRLIPAATR